MTWPPNIPRSPLSSNWLGKSQLSFAWLHSFKSSWLFSLQAQHCKSYHTGIRHKASLVCECVHKTLTTTGTGIRPCVTAHMDIQSLFLNKGLTAVGANIRPFSCLNALVDIQFRFPNKGFTKVGAEGLLYECAHGHLTEFSEKKCHSKRDTHKVSLQCECIHVLSNYFSY